MINRTSLEGQLTGFVTAVADALSHEPVSGCAAVGNYHPFLAAALARTRRKWW